jgi:uncharacterized protein (DUF58 family)
LATPAASPALSAKVVAAIDDLELVARRVVEGMRAGHNRSPFHGFSTEFRQHRPYRQGDDLKYLDWKLFGRSDRLYTRQFHETTNLAAIIVLDTSASMAFPQEDLSKFRYGVIVAAALAHLISGQGDMVGLMTMTGERLTYLPARGGRLHLRSLLARLDGLEPAGRFDAPRVIARAAQLLRRRGLMIVISDFYDAEAETRRELRRVAQYGHDVAMLQLLSPQEIALPYDGHLELEDLESGARRLTDAADVATSYRATIGEFLARCRNEALRAGIDYAMISTETPPEKALRDYLLARRTPQVPAR